MCRHRKLSDKEKAAILERARTGKLQTNLVLERARSDSLLGAGSSATCSELTNIIAIDQKALTQETLLLKKMKSAQEASQTETLKEQMAAEVTRIKAIDERLTASIEALRYEEAVKCGLL